jgi:hypothetical protein
VNPFPYASSAHYPLPPPLEQRPPPPRPPFSQGIRGDPSSPNLDPFGYGSGAYPHHPTSGATPPNPSQLSNPMFMDGYRTILEQLLGGIGQATLQQQPPPSVPNQDNPPYPGQGRYTWGSTSTSSSFQGPSIRLGGTANSPSPQPQQPLPTRHFHYSMTTYGPDGTVRHISSNSPPDSQTPEGRQIAVPTVEDFLGMHGFPGYQQDPFANGSFGMMLQHMMGMTHSNPGDYLRPVIFPSNTYRKFLTFA